MARPRLLDLFCGAGGAAMGYARAGFDVVGVDIKPQPRYPFRFVQGDAIEEGARLLASEEWDAIHASPPCQAFSSATPETARANHPNLIPPTRELLRSTTLPYVIENVPGAPLIGSIMLCGSSFGLGVGDLFQVRRHRYFETRPPLLVAPPCQHIKGRFTIDLAGGGGAMNPNRHRKGTADQRREALGCDWMSRDEISQAIPPAYTEYIGRALLQELRAAA